MLMMHDGEDALLVDISLCVRNAWRSPRWVFESKTVIMVVGYVESSVVSRDFFPVSLPCTDVEHTRPPSRSPFCRHMRHL